LDNKAVFVYTVTQYLLSIIHTITLKVELYVNSVLFSCCRRLVTALYEANKADTIDKLHDILVNSTVQLQTNMQHMTITQNQKLIWYSGYIRERHSQIHIAVVSNKWLPSPTRKFFKLAIIKKEGIQRGALEDELVRMTLQGQVDNILMKKSPIELKDLFRNIEGKRKVVLIDGAPGSGKSTLTVHICQRWSEGELFQDFTIVLLVQLRDPAVQNAQSIADLIPCRNRETAQQVASAITDIDGRGILWILDGWDELPSHFRDKSFLKDMIAPSLHSPIAQSSVIVTSRQITSGELSEVVSSRIEVLGFTWEEQRQYFNECLKGDTKAVDILMDRLSENPAMEGSCYLPLNASIVAHLYLSDGSLPHTIYGVFSSLVQHCLSHYLCERRGKAQARLKSLDKLPQELQAPFNQLCKLAFTGVSLNQITFSQDDLKAVKESAIICDVGLLQATPSILSDGKTLYYNFIHLSIQEMLSAVYISHMPASEQISAFDSLFSEPRFSRVFQFYAAITKLCTTRSFLGKLPNWLCPVPAGVLDIVKKIIKKRVTKPIIVSLLHCLYEAQDPSLCQFVAEQLKNGLYLNNTTLIPVDSLAIGYFLYSVTHAPSNVDEFRVDLGNCSLGDAGTKSLMQSISKNVHPQSVVNVPLKIYLCDNEIHEEGASHIAEILNSTNIVSKLILSRNPIGDKGLQTIFKALKQNKTLKVLSVHNCDLTDTGVTTLADALQTNSTLEILNCTSNEGVTENGLAYLAEALSKQSGLVKVWLPSHLEENSKKNINEARKRNGLADIEVH
jgi:hypothetical protein